MTANEMNDALKIDIFNAVNPEFPESPEVEVLPLEDYYYKGYVVETWMLDNESSTSL